MKLLLTTSGLLDPKRLDSWVPEKRRAIRKAVESFDENLNDSIQRTTLRYVERGVATVTGNGEHQLGERNKTAWSLTYGNTGRKEPDRSDVVYARTPEPDLNDPAVQFQGGGFVKIGPL